MAAFAEAGTGVAAGSGAASGSFSPGPLLTGAAILLAVGGAAASGGKGGNSAGADDRLSQGNTGTTTPPVPTEPPAPVTPPSPSEPPAVKEPPAVVEPPSVSPPATEPPATEPPAAEPPATEPPASQSPPPVYKQDIDTLRVPFQKTLAIGEQHPTTLTGSAEGHAPAALRITEMQIPHPQGQAVQDRTDSPLYLQDGNGQRTVLSEKDGHNIIRAEDFARLHWDGTKSDGGWFAFEALDAQGHVITGADGKPVTHRVEVDEDAIAGHWDTVDKGTIHNVANDSITWLTANAYGPAPETLRFFRMGDIKAWENSGYTRIERDASLTEDGTTHAYELVLKPGLTLEEARAQAAERGAKLLTIETQAEADWLLVQVKGGQFGMHDTDLGPDDEDLSQYLYTSTLGSADGTPQVQGSNAKGFIMEFSDYKPPLRVHSATDLDAFEYVKTGQVLSNHDLQRLTWDSTHNNGGRIYMQELLPDAGDPTKASNTPTGGWLEWAFEEKDRLGTYGAWDDVHTHIGIRSVTAEATEAAEAAEAPPSYTASAVDLWHGSRLLVDDPLLV